MQPLPAGIQSTPPRAHVHTITDNSHSLSPLTGFPGFSGLRPFRCCARTQRDQHLGGATTCRGAWPNEPYFPKQISEGCDNGSCSRPFWAVDFGMYWPLACSRCEVKFSGPCLSAQYVLWYCLIACLAGSRCEVRRWH